MSKVLTPNSGSGQAYPTTIGPKLNRLAVIARAGGEGIAGACAYSVSPARQTFRCEVFDPLRKRPVTAVWTGLG